MTALRSLFTWARRVGVIFRNPATQIHFGRRENPIWQPLTATDISETVTAAKTPQARLCVALAAVHAARPGQIRAITLDDVNIGGRQFTITGRARPLDDLTHRLLIEWLDHRRAQGPHTANRHLLISRETALRHGPVSVTYILDLRGTLATLERLRIDRQLEEALDGRGDPLRLAAVLGISHTAAMRYALNARQLLEDDQADTPSESSRTRAPDPGNVHNGRSGSARWCFSFPELELVWRRRALTTSSCEIRCSGGPASRWKKPPRGHRFAFGCAHQGGCDVPSRSQQQYEHGEDAGEA